MREILFRARWKDTNKTVEDFTYDYIIDACNDDVFIVEQYIGLSDIKGNKIFEGDRFILKGHECVVKYRENYCDYIFENLKWGDRVLNVTKANITKYKLEIIKND